MDYSRLRTNDELSDLTVVVAGEEFPLHRFPLYASSHFFRQLAESQSDGSRVELADFPGGAVIFSLVADHCYGLNVVMTTANVCQLRCAAEYLGMTSDLGMTSGDACLATRADGYLDNSLAGAKQVGRLTTPVELLQQCRDLGETAEKVTIIGRCIETIVDMWAAAPPSDQTRKRQPRLSHDTPPERCDATFFRTLCQLPVNWIVQLFMAGRDKPVESSILAAILRAYVANVLGQPTEMDDDDDDNSVPSAEDKQEDVEEKESDGEASSLGDSAAVREALDLMLTELPSDGSITASVPPPWAVSTLQTASRYGCRARPTLLTISAQLFHRLDTRALCRLTPELLCELARAAIAADQPGAAAAVCLAIDRYLAEMAARDALTTELFASVVAAVPADKRTSHDTLFDVLETLLKSERGETTDEQKRHLVESVDFRRLSESTLQRAYESELVPDAYVTKAALALCTRLRTELQELRATADAQGAELVRLREAGGARHGGEWTRSPAAMTSPRDPLSKYEPIPVPVAPPLATTASLSSDLELQLAMEALGKVYSRSPPDVSATMPSAAAGAYNAYRYRHYLDDRVTTTGASGSDAGDIYRHLADLRPARYAYSPRSFTSAR